MYQAKAVIRKVGDEYCVFSKDGKNLGCSKSRDGAEKRLKQVEYFKHIKGSADMTTNYKDFFSNLGKTVSSEFNPTEIVNAPESEPRKVHVPSETLSVADRLTNGSLAGQASDKLLDRKDHFPVVTETQARSSMARVMQLNEIPSWYSGTLAQLRKDVYDGIMNVHPDIKLDVRISAEQAVALSDGAESGEVSQQSIKDPHDELKTKKDHVPQVARPTLTSAELVDVCQDEATRLALGGRLMELLDKQVEQIQAARNLGQRLIQSGLNADEFDKLSTFIQQDILVELMQENAEASDKSEARRKELLKRMSNG